MVRKLVLGLVMVCLVAFAAQASAQEMMEGTVTALGPALITVGDTTIDAKGYDLAGINIGDNVKVTYKTDSDKKIVESVEKIAE
jgi:hypothetical protein